MAWIYCDCGSELDNPTDREILTDDYRCGNCDKDNSYQIDERYKAEAMGRVLDRLEALEAKHV